MPGETHSRGSEEEQPRNGQKYEELAMQPRDLSREEGERIPLTEIEKWKPKMQEGSP